MRQRPGQALLFDMKAPQFLARVAPAPSLKDPTARIDRVVPGVRIGLQDAVVVPQVSRRVLALAAGRVLERHRQWRLVAAGAVIANVPKRRVNDDALRQVCP
jgi:hypothetical protein